MQIEIHTEQKTYPIYLQKGILNQLKLDGYPKLCLVCDDGVPRSYIQTVLSQYPHAEVLTFPHGEQNKNWQTLEQILMFCAKHQLHRQDCIVAIGGGVVGDMAGLAAAMYMRGIHFVNIPTTTLSQIDSSIGGKTAIDFMGYKNIVGAFYQPDAVYIDPDVLKTLDQRNYDNGLVEALKAGMIQDPLILEEFEKSQWDIEKIIYLALKVKQRVVEEDEKEMGIRKILNFGHTVGHAIESYYDGQYLHGECVGLGMYLMMDEGKAKQRLHHLLKRLNIPLDIPIDNEVLKRMKWDKKGAKDSIDIILVKQIGQAEIQRVSYEQLERMLKDGK